MVTQGEALEEEDRCSLDGKAASCHQDKGWNNLLLLANMNSQNNEGRKDKRGVPAGKGTTQRKKTASLAFRARLFL